MKAVPKASRAARQPVFARRLAEALDNAGVTTDKRHEIMAGSERLRTGATPEQKANWYRGAI